jgi:hypothetical protein
MRYVIKDGVHTEIVESDSFAAALESMIDMSDDTSCIFPAGALLKMYDGNGELVATAAHGTQRS